MHRFFVFPQNIVDGAIFISGDDVAHISRVLRLTVGDEICVCDRSGRDYVAVIESIEKTAVVARATYSCQSVGEPQARVTLYQGLPKADKMDAIVQKSVELGVHAIVPVATHRSVVRLDEKSAAAKVERWQKIALEAAKQSRRGIIPQVCPVQKLTTLQKSLHCTEDRKSSTQPAAPHDVKEPQIFANCNNAGHTSDASNSNCLHLVAYELGGVSVKTALNGTRPRDISVYIGPEGGFEQSEVDFLTKAGAVAMTLGPRILRTETASAAILAVLMHELET